jgi:hypothetical protein
VGSILLVLCLLSLFIFYSVPIPESPDHSRHLLHAPPPCPVVSPSSWPFWSFFRAGRPAISTVKRRPVDFPFLPFIFTCGLLLYLRTGRSY